MEHTEFSRQMLVLARLFNESTEPPAWTEKLRIYWQVFKAWPDAQFKTAVLRHVETGRFFPKPAELRALGVVPGMTPEEAWEELMANLNKVVPAYSSPLIAKAANAIGHDILWNMTYDQVPTTRAHFFRIFTSLQARQEAKHYPALGVDEPPAMITDLATKLSLPRGTPT